MKTHSSRTSIALVCYSAMAIATTGYCSSKSKEPAEHHRGWIGGEFKTVSVLPPELKGKQRHAILITSLNTNTPAILAGMAEGDLILELNHEPITGLKKFHRTIDAIAPGKSLSAKIWREGQTLECNVRVGRETFTYNGVFAIGLPGFFHDLRLWPGGGFSLGVVGYETEPVGERKELTSAEARYFSKYDPKNYHVTDEGWKAWAAIMQASTFKTIRSQEVVPAETSSLAR